MRLELVLTQPTDRHDHGQWRCRLISTGGRCASGRDHLTNLLASVGVVATRFDHDALLELSVFGVKGREAVSSVCLGKSLGNRCPNAGLLNLKVNCRTLDVSVNGGAREREAGCDSGAEALAEPDAARDARDNAATPASTETTCSQTTQSREPVARENTRFAGASLKAR